MAKKGMFNKLGNFMGLTSEVTEEVDVEEEYIDDFELGEELEQDNVKSVQPKEASKKVMGFNEIKERKEIKRRESYSAEGVTIEHSILEPKYFEDVTRIADEFKLGNKMITINISKLSKEEARRTLDFVSGLSYALDSKFTRVGRDVFQLLPGHIKQVNEIESATKDDFYSSDLS
ncbi:MAG: cell division protein SepF [Fusobacteria bacterium]|nr:cell division protein SepF [Fusobacteriota bacterium]